MADGARARLARERRATLARLRGALADHESIMAAADGANADDEHDPEGSTVAFERAQVAALVARGRRALDELDRALARLDAGTYGNCQRCGSVIGAERLAALPTTTTCVGCAP